MCVKVLYLPTMNILNYTNESISLELVQFLIKYRSDIVRAR